MISRVAKVEIRDAGGMKKWPLPVGITGNAVFDDTGDYRYVLTRSWPDEMTLATMSFNGRTVPEFQRCVFVGLNPSTADPLFDDPTIRKCWTWARGWGYAEMVMLNAYGYRATAPADMKAAADPIGPGNDGWLQAFAELPGSMIAAWGAGIDLDRESKVLGIMRRAEKKVCCLGLTNEGRPRHPLYLPNITQPRLWIP